MGALLFDYFWNVWFSSFFLFFFFFLLEFPLLKENPLIFMKSFKKFSSFIFWNFFMEICPLKICSRDFYFEYLFMRSFLLKIYSGNFSFYEDVFMEICPLKIFLGDFSFWRFVQEIFPFMKIYSGDFPFMKMYSWRFVLWRFV